MAFNIPFAVGDGPFKSEMFSGAQSISIGASGDIAVLTPALGRRVRLERLVAAAFDEPGISILVGSTNVISSKTLTTENSFGGFQIGQSGITRADGQSGTILNITGKINEVIKIVKDTGSTIRLIRFSYHYGV